MHSFNAQIFFHSLNTLTFVHSFIAQDSFIHLLPKDSFIHLNVLRCSYDFGQDNTINEWYSLTLSVSYLKIFLLCNRSSLGNLCYSVSSARFLQESTAKRTDPHVNYKRDSTKSARQDPVSTSFDVYCKQQSY